MATKKKEHSVQVLLHGARFVAVEEAGHIRLMKDGSPAGKAIWKNDQLVDNSSVFPDDVIDALEKKLKDAMDRNWDEE